MQEVLVMLGVRIIVFLIRCSGLRELPKKKKIRLYHYFVKNKKHFEEKVNKGMADRNAKRSMDEFYYYDKNDVINYKAISVRDYILKK